jgi:hypothetical protein
MWSLRNPWHRVFATLLVGVFSCTARAQSGGEYSLGAWAVDGGGGRASGGGFTLDGTLSLPAAATLAGGKYRLTQGVWAIEAQGTPVVTPTLEILPSQGGSLLLQWDYPATGFVLQWTDRLSGEDGTVVWHNWEGTPPVLANGLWRVLVSPSTSGVFFRLFKP